MLLLIKSSRLEMLAHFRLCQMSLVYQLSGQASQLFGLANFNSRSISQEEIQKTPKGPIEVAESKGVT